MSTALPHIVIRSETGSGKDTTITIDGEPLKGIMRYRITHEPLNFARVTIELAPAVLEIDHPAAVLAAIQRPDDSAARDEWAFHERASAALLTDMMEGRPHTDYPTLEARAIAGTQLDGVDVERLAERYVDLTPARRDAVRLAVGLPASGVLEPISDAFSLAHEAGKLKEFDAAVRAALVEQCEDEADLRDANRVLAAGETPVPWEQAKRELGLSGGATTTPCDSEGEE